MAHIAARTELEVVEAVRSARASVRSVEIVGAGTKRNLGRPIETHDVLDVSAVSGIMSYEPDELVITCAANTPIVEIEAALAERNQRLGFEPADWGPLLGAAAGAATIGGVLSADANGCARVRFGACRDHLLGYRAVNGFGEAYKTGGRVVKNVTGFDLPKLMCGAFGTLGILTEVTLRLVPRPSETAAFAVRGLNINVGLRFLRSVWSSPLDATALSYIPAGMTKEFGQASALVRIEGTPAALGEKVELLRALAGDHLIEDADAAAFAALASGAPFVNSDHDVWRVVIPPARAADVISTLKVSHWYADWAGGLLWVALPIATSSERVQSVAKEAGGHAVLMRADNATRFEFAGLPPRESSLREVSRAVKTAFDPLSIFNPGRLSGDF